MKRVMTVLMALTLLFCLAACGPKDIFEVKQKQYTKDGMSITLPKVFEEVNYGGLTVCYNTDEITVFVCKETVKAESLEEYADIVYENNADVDPSPIEKIEGLTTMEYSYYNPAAQVRIWYFTVMYEGPDAFWQFQFACDDAHYEAYKPHFIEWAKTVTFD